MRLIDADELLEHVYRDKLNTRELIAKMIENAPTIVETDKSISPITNIVETPLVIADRIIKECNYDNKKIKKVVKYLKQHIKMDTKNN